MSQTLDQPVLLSAMHQLLAPLTRLALARGLPYAALDELLRAALVREARRLHADVPGHGLVSRVSTTTGLTRREVSRLLEAGDEAPLPAPPRAGPQRRLQQEEGAEGASCGGGRPLCRRRSAPAQNHADQSLIRLRLLAAPM